MLCSPRHRTGPGRLPACSSPIVASRPRPNPDGSSSIRTNPFRVFENHRYRTSTRRRTERKSRILKFTRLAGARKPVPARLAESYGTRSRNFAIVRTNTTVAPNDPPPERAAEVTLTPPLPTRIPVTSATIMPVRIAITTSAALTPFGPIFVLPNEQLPCWKRIVDDLTVEAFRVLDSDVQRRGHVDSLLREILAAVACRFATDGHSAARVAPDRSDRSSRRRRTSATNIESILLQDCSDL